MKIEKGTKEALQFIELYFGSWILRDLVVFICPFRRLQC